MLQILHIYRLFFIANFLHLVSKPSTCIPFHHNLCCFIHIVICTLQGIEKVQNRSKKQLENCLYDKVTYTTQLNSLLTAKNQKAITRAFFCCFSVETGIRSPEDTNSTHLCGCVDIVTNSRSTKAKNCSHSIPSTSTFTD